MTLEGAVDIDQEEVRSFFNSKSRDYAQLLIKKAFPHLVCVHVDSMNGLITGATRDLSLGRPSQRETPLWQGLANKNTACDLSMIGRNRLKHLATCISQSQKEDCANQSDI